MLSAKQIEIFYEVYKNTSMTAAAQSLEISQPSISKTLGVIEKKLNFKLFLRKGKNLFRLTKLMTCLNMRLSFIVS